MYLELRMNIEFDCEEIRKWTLQNKSFSSTEDVFVYFEDGLHNKKWAYELMSHWRNEQIYHQKKY